MSTGRPRGLFVTGAGTGIGKTLVTAALAHQCRARGESVMVMKPVVTGYDAAEAAGSDPALLLRAAGFAVNDATIAACSPWRFAAPISPDMAAAREGRVIAMDELIAACRKALAGGVTGLIEGIGGAMVPLDARHTVRDLIAALGIPAVVVTGNYLGALSHTLTAAAALAARGVRLAGVVVSDGAEPPVPLAEAMACLARFLPGIAVLGVPRLAPAPRPWEAVPELTELLDNPRAACGP